MATQPANIVALRACVMKAMGLIYKRTNSDKGVDRLIPDGTAEDVSIEVKATVDGQVFSEEFVVPVKKGHSTWANVAESPDFLMVVAHLLDKLPTKERDRFLIDFPREFQASGNNLAHRPVTLQLVRDTFSGLRYQTGEKKQRAGAISTPKVKRVSRRKQKIHKLA